MLSMAGEVVLTSLVGWAMAERWSFTLLARLAPKTSSATRRLLESRMVPGTWLRRRAIANAERLVAHQSHPAA